MNKLQLAAILTLGLSLGTISCQSSTNNEMAPSATEAPSGMTVAKYHFDKDKPL